MQGQPLVSIIMPAFNRGNIIEKAINSVINQTYSNWELIVVDDRSTDNTKAVIEGISRNDNRIRYILNDRKKGPSGARNCGIINSNGEYLAFLDSDDEWLSNHLIDSINVLTNEGVDVTFALWIENRSQKSIKFDQQEGIKEKFAKAFEVLKPKIKEQLVFFNEGFYEFTILEAFYCYHINTMVFKKSILDTIGLLDESLFANEDNDFTYRVFHDYAFCLIMDYHFLYNQGDDNLYLFIDRSLADIEKISDDRNLIDKLTFNGNLENIMRIKRKRYVKESKKLKDKRKCLKIINRSIADKYITLGYINRKISKLTSLNFYLKAMTFCRDRVTFIFIGALIFPLFNKKAKAMFTDFDLG
jgi:glycosyltransferase involved in cell wall biosynthesis